MYRVWFTRLAYVPNSNIVSLSGLQLLLVYLIRVEGYTHVCGRASDYCVREGKRRPGYGRRSRCDGDCGMRRGNRSCQPTLKLRKIDKHI